MSHLLIFAKHAWAGWLLEVIENYDNECITCFWFLLFFLFLKLLSFLTSSVYLPVYWTFLLECVIINLFLWNVPLYFLIHHFLNDWTGNLGVIFDFSFHKIFSPTSPIINKSSNSLEYLPFQSTLNLD